MTRNSDPTVERFSPTAGRFTGIASICVGLLFTLSGASDGTRSLPLVFGGLMVAAVAWGSMVRPALFAKDHVLVMRNMFVTTRIPLAAIERVEIRQVLMAWVAARRHVSPVVGRTRRRVQRDGDRLVPDRTPIDEVPYAKYVHDRLAELMSEARAEAGVEHESVEQNALASHVIRTIDPLPVAVIGMSTLAFVVTMVVAYR